MSGPTSPCVSKMISSTSTLFVESTVPGSGSDSFPVDNGRGKLMLELAPGTYTVTVQDLHAGVHDYHTKSKELSVKGEDSTQKSSKT